MILASYDKIKNSPIPSLFSLCSLRNSLKTQGLAQILSEYFSRNFIKLTIGSTVGDSPTVIPSPCTVSNNMIAG